MTTKLDECVISSDHVTGSDQVIGGDHVFGGDHVIGNDHVFDGDHVIGSDHVTGGDHVINGDHVTVATRTVVKVNSSIIHIILSVDEAHIQGSSSVIINH